MNPTEVNWIGVLDELNRLGVIDYHIEILCDLTDGYVRQIRCGHIKNPSYTKGTKLMNLLDKEMEK